MGRKRNEIRIEADIGSTVAYVYFGKKNGSPRIIGNLTHCEIKALLARMICLSGNK